MSKSDKTLDELGYKRKTPTNTRYESDKTYIRFRTDENTVYIAGVITMEELKAINKKCEELGWL